MGEGEVYPSLCRVAVVKFTVVPSNLIPVFRLIQPVASRTTKRGGRKLTKMYEDANLTTSLNVYIRPCCILTC